MLEHTSITEISYDHVMHLTIMTLETRHAETMQANRSRSHDASCVDRLIDFFFANRHRWLADRAGTMR